MIIKITLSSSIKLKELVLVKMCNPDSYLHSCPTLPPPLDRGAQFLNFSVQKGRGDSNFFHKKGGVGSLGGGILTKEGRGYDLFSY